MIKTFFENGHREEIDGFRAISALLVAIFHIWVGGVSGGVDVFLVLTGYFLTKRVYEIFEQRSTYSALSSYKNFILRVAPETLVALSAILVFGLYIQHPVSWLSFLSEYFASALYFENYALIKKGADYLERDEAPSIVQHFWAVSMIGQIYILWPVFVRIAMLRAENQLASFRRNFVIILSLLFITSLIWSVIETGKSPEKAYFDLTTRLWEFAAGGLAASYRSNKFK
jgi:peptidoglycan/LPS O-acetylase OafA/YrhL